MRYRGFNVESQVYGDGTLFEITVYAGDDDLRRHALLDICDINLDDKDALDSELRHIVDDYYDDIVSNENFYKLERYKELLGRAVTWLGESEQGSDLYNTLTEFVGMTDDEIRTIGFTSLAPYFDRDGYAQTIAEFITDYGTKETTSGNYLIPFEEINKRFGVDLFHDEELLDKIFDSFDWDIVSGVDINDGEFDMTFYTDYCPDYYDSISQDWG